MQPKVYKCYNHDKSNTQEHRTQSLPIFYLNQKMNSFRVAWENPKPHKKEKVNS